MGTHHKSPTLVLSSGEKLSEYLASRPHLVGDRVVKRFSLTDGQIPFLFKVLSFRKALPMQIHPDKMTAERLHAEQPDVYADANHKPEMALALSPFSAMCGFLPVVQIASYLQAVPEFSALVPKVIADQLISIVSSSRSEVREKGALRDLFSAFLTADVKDVKVQLDRLVQRYRAGNYSEEEEKVKDLVLKLSEMYPGDNGVFCAFLLNYLELQPGQAICVVAGEPHAYVMGDIIECMATSDNVIEAGFTSGVKDISNFVSGLQYNLSSGRTRIFKPTPLTRPGSFGGGTLVYDPPIDELAVMQVVVGKGKSEKHPGLRGPSIAIVLDGHGSVEWAAGDRSMEGRMDMELGRGDTIFIGQGVEVNFSASVSDLRVYRAYVEAE
ncbi:mannose-6-phosphate isomerase [Leucogyrophana mollusca]|uniref:Mannose-6-phosphate isomerase n=1 Tax=Leucogyrophana mollusca TaxID=85980 RepID=A0ACB8BH28_9AGAM|nr:mannose-6-phosphate isomerase [Leucogyrophana mollusca]